jgi:hypothetical protein
MVARNLAAPIYLEADTPGSGRSWIQPGFVMHDLVEFLPPGSGSCLAQFERRPRRGVELMDVVRLSHEDLKIQAKGSGSLPDQGLQHTDTETEIPVMDYGNLGGGHVKHRQMLVGESADTANPWFLVSTNRCGNGGGCVGQTEVDQHIGCGHDGVKVRADQCIVGKIKRTRFLRIPQPDPGQLQPIVFCNRACDRLAHPPGAGNAY